MTAQDMLSTDLPRLEPGQTVADALELLETHFVAELPIVDAQGRYLALARAALLEGVPDDQTRLSDLPPQGALAFVSVTDHFFELLRVAAEQRTTQVAVLDAEGIFVGTVLMSDLAARLGQGLSLTAGGGILVLAMDERRYSMAEIARLVESNEGRVLNSFIEAVPEDPAKITVTLRINQLDLTRTIATFERFGYVVAARYHQSLTPDLDQERLDSLLRYLSI